MPIFSSTITDLATNKMSQPYYRFDGSNDYINLGSISGTFDHATIMTISMWVRTSSTVAAAILSDESGSGYAGVFLLYVQVDGTVLWRRGNGASAEWGYVSTKTVNDGEWHHIVGIDNGSALSLYIDGVSDTAASTPGSYATAGASGQPVIIGALARDVATGNFKGEISSIAVYSVALSSAEVSDLYAGGNPPWKYRGAINTELISSTNDRTFAGASNWSNAGSNAYDESGDLTLGSTATYQGATLPAANAPMTVGKRYRLKFTTSGLSGDGFVIRNYDQNYVDGLANIPVSSGANSYDFTYGPIAGATTGGGFKIIAVGTGGMTFDNFSLIQIGAIAEWDGSGIAGDKWFDKSGNGLHGTVSGATVENKLQATRARIHTPINSGTAASSANGSATTYTLQGISYSVHRLLQTRTDFIVTRTLFADILLVGGGGGGGTDLSGGGYGGGVLYVANYEIPAGTYTVTVGAAGAAAGAGSASTFHNLSAGGGKAGGATGPSAVGVISITANPNTYDFCEAYGGYSAAIPGGNATFAGTGASGTDYGYTHGRLGNSAAEDRSGTGGAGAYINDYAGNLIYNGTTAYAWGAGGGGPGYGGWGGHGGNGGGGGGGEFYAYNSPEGYPGKGGLGGINNGVDGTHLNSALNGGAGGANTGGGGGAGSHRGGGATSTLGGPGGSGICLIRYRN